MKILCIGAGAIGSYIAGSLALIGNPLVYVEQPGFIDHLKANGVRIEDINGEKHHLKRFDAYGSAEEAFPGMILTLSLPQSKVLIRMMSSGT